MAYDNVIDAYCWHSTLQSPLLEHHNQFQSPFVQVLVSNIGCLKDEVYVYDTMYSSVPTSTANTIAHLTSCSSSVLTIKMVDV